MNRQISIFCWYSIFFILSVSFSEVLYSQGVGNNGPIITSKNRVKTEFSGDFESICPSDKSAKSTISEDAVMSKVKKLLDKADFKEDKIKNLLITLKGYCEGYINVELGLIHFLAQSGNDTYAAPIFQGWLNLAEDPIYEKDFNNWGTAYFYEAYVKAGKVKNKETEGRYIVLLRKLFTQYLVELNTPK